MACRARVASRAVSDLHDPEYAERLDHDAPDEALRRRDFLQRLAVGAGAAATLGTVLDPEVLMSEAARPPRPPRHGPRPGGADVRARPPPAPDAPAQAAQHAGRHLRRADDGEPVV